MKTFFVFLILLVGAPFGVWKLYQYRHPAPRPLPSREEISLTIIPGWDLRDVAGYLVTKNVASSTRDVYEVTGVPGRDTDSAEGTLAPETVRFFKGATVTEVVKTFQNLRTKQITAEIQAEMDRQKISLAELLTMASIVEKEARHDSDRGKVANILWRRIQKNWALQVDSSVHYAIDKNGTVYTTDQERATPSRWNTYKYPGLPPGPICMPSIESIQAALIPEKNEYWYFLSGKDGKMYYAKTLDEHNANRFKYLR